MSKNINKLMLEIEKLPFLSIYLLKKQQNDISAATQRINNMLHKPDFIKKPPVNHFTGGFQKNITPNIFFITYFLNTRSDCPR